MSTATASAAVHKLTSKLKKQTLVDKNTDDESASADVTERERPKLRKSARLARRPLSNESGTDESEDEELVQLTSSTGMELGRQQSAYMMGRSPPTIVSSPPPLTERSGRTFTLNFADHINQYEYPAEDQNEYPGNNNREWDPSDKQNNSEEIRRGRSTPKILDGSPLSGEKRRHSMTAGSRDLPIACRLRSNNEAPREREIIVAARRAPVRLLIHKPASTKPLQPAGGVKEEVEEEEDFPPQHKRGRTNYYGRPSLDLNKMLEHRISSNNFLPIGVDIGNEAQLKANVASDWVLPSCSHGAHVPCAQSNCHFKPLCLEDKNEPRAAM